MSAVFEFTLVNHPTDGVVVVEIAGGVLLNQFHLSHGLCLVGFPHDDHPTLRVGINYWLDEYSYSYRLRGYIFVGITLTLYALRSLSVLSRTALNNAMVE